MYKYKEIKVPKFCESEGFYTTKAQSDLMSKIRSQNTECEILLRKTLWNLGYRYRKNVKSLPGKPDIVFRKFKLVIFIDGDFWHGFRWENRKPKLISNLGYWIPKIERNIQRDNEQKILLQKQGFKVLRFWEHEIKKQFDLCLKTIVDKIDQAKV